MKELSLQEKKDKSLEILLFINKICLEHDIIYYLGYGTLLGAIRHKGFIPWDDDIDLIMFRKDYSKFLDILCDECKETDYNVISFENNSFPLPFTKIVNTRTVIKTNEMVDLPGMAIGVDIFPFDYMPGTIDEIMRKKKRLNYDEKLIRYSLYNNINELLEGKINVAKILYYMLAKTKKWVFWARRYQKIIRKQVKYNDAEYCGVWSSMNNSIIPVFESSIFDNRIDVQFENYSFPAPQDYDMFLRTVYGDYMELPPETSRVPHSNRAYIFE